MQEKVIEIKQCNHCDTKFEITDKDLEFYEKVSPVFAGIKYNIPTPTLCPDCRQQRRLSFRNERNLYKRNCDATGKQIISIYSPDKPYKVYNPEFWWSDKWDAMDYGKEFDFNRGFFEQFDELTRDVPRVSSSNTNNNENSNYGYGLDYCKDCYLITNGDNCINCLYSSNISKCSNVLDSLFISNGENCYECIDIENCINCFYVSKSISCSNSYFLDNCNNCDFCYGCSNLTNKRYFINNEGYSKEDYFELIKSGIEINLPNVFKISNRILNSDECTGDSIIDSKNCYNCFDIVNSELGKNSIVVVDGTNFMDISYGAYHSELCYEGVSAGLSLNKVCFVSMVYYSNNCFYSDLCSSCSNIFGCVGLRNKSYCIFNKQYTKEEYEKLVPKIIEHMMKTGEWGEFFPSSLSPFGYNETVAMEYFPLSREEVQKKGFNWIDYEQPLPNVEKIIQASKLPENISDIPDDILNWAIECEVTKKPFRIIKLELEFYRKHNLPIPRKHPDQRHLDRMKLRNPRKLFDRKCDKCGVDMKTTYSSDRKELVYCEKCYEKEVY